MNTLVVARTTPQSTIVVGSPHIVIMSGPALMKGQDKSVHILIATTSHEDIQTLTVQWHKSACTRSKIECVEGAKGVQKQAEVHL